jgi:hypothetical protein
MDQGREGEPADDREGEAEQHLLEGHPGVVRKQ